VYAHIQAKGAVVVNASVVEGQKRVSRLVPGRTTLVPRISRFHESSHPSWFSSKDLARLVGSDPHEAHLITIRSM